MDKLTGKEIELHTKPAVDKPEWVTKLAEQEIIALPEEVHPPIWPDGDLATAAPSTVALVGVGFLRSGRLQVREAIKVAIFEAGGQTIAGAEDLATAAPSTVALGFLRDGELRVREAIEVAILEEDGQIIAEAEELNEFGAGDNQSEAVIDLQHAIAELYFSLEEDKDRLGPGLQRVWEVLQVKVEKR